MEDVTGEMNKDVETQSGQIVGSEKEQLYGDVIHKEARFLLIRYLPEVLPQEPTEIFLNVFPQYIGKFKGKHFVAAERVVYSHAQQKQFDEMMKRHKDSWEEFLKELDEQFSSSKEEPEPEPKPEPEDWEEPERLLEGRDQYSVDTWRVIYSLVHELIHQRQAELNPQAFPQLQSSDLDNVDLDNTSEKELNPLLIEAHKSHSRTMDNNSLFYPIAEGMAVMGSFYVMGKLLADLKESGQADTAEKVRQVRNKTIRLELSGTKREEGAGEVDSYNLHYIEGVGIIRKLYRQFGIENIPGLLKSVDLIACRGIVKDTPQYQQMMKNPALLPGLQTVSKP